MSLCKYKDIFGNPREGNHELRDPIFGTAFNDVIMTIIGSYIISYVFNYSFGITLLVIFIIGILLHRAFCVRTTVDKFLFPNIN